VPGTEASVAILGPVRALAAMLLLAAAPRWAPAAQVPAAATSLARLADAAAAELLRAAAGRAIALAPIEDRTRASPLASDLQALLAARLEGHVVAGSGTAIPRVDVTSVIAEAGPRLVWTGRLVDESGALVDVLSASAPWDADSLPLFRAHSGPDESAVDVLEHATTPPMEGRIVALAFAGDDRLLVLFDDALALYRRDGLSLRLESRRELPGPLAPVRVPGGLLLAVERESSCWAMTSRSPRAVLFSLEGTRLVPVQQADVLPWPGAAAGARFRPGTNLLEVALPGLDGPVLALEAERGWAVDAGGVLARLGNGSAASSGPRVGSALAPLWPGALAAASAEPPGEHDRILVLAEGDGSVEGPPAGALVVDGTARALATRRQPRGVLLAAALEDPRGGFRIALFSLGERK